MRVTEHVDGGWLIHWKAGTWFHVTEEWIEGMERHQLQGRNLRDWNRLKWLIRSYRPGTDDEAEAAKRIGETFRAAYPAIVSNASPWTPARQGVVESAELKNRLRGAPRERRARAEAETN